MTWPVVFEELVCRTTRACGCDGSNVGRLGKFASVGEPVPQHPDHDIRIVDAGSAEECLGQVFIEPRPAQQLVAVMQQLIRPIIIFERNAHV